MIDPDWLSDRLCDVLRWQLTNPGRRDGPEVPWAGRRIWSIFLDLNATRGSNGWGPNPISHSEVEAWSRLHREPVRPHELEILRAMDTAYLKHATQTASKGQQSTSKVESRPMSTALFDAVFQ